MRGRIGLALGAVLVSATAVLATSPASAGVQSPHPGAGSPGSPAAIDWKPCAFPGFDGEIPPGVECATIQVPLDWSKPHGEKSPIALSRRKATDASARLGTLVFGNGGPGIPGAPLVAMEKGLFSAEVARRYDIVGFDPPGVGGSNPIRCGHAALSKLTTKAPTSQAEFDALAKNNAAVADDCRKRSGPIYDHADTVSAAYALDAVRAALGERKLNYYGISYGSQLGQQYAELFPKRVGRMVFDSNVDHSQPNPTQYLGSQSAAVEDTFRDFAAWCARTAGCALHGRDVVALLDALYARAQRGQLTAATTPPASITAAQLTDLLQVGIDFGYPHLSEMLAVLHDGTTPSSAMQEFLADVLDGQQPPPGDTVDFAGQAIMCADWRMTAHSYPQLQEFRRNAERQAPHTKVILWGPVVFCHGWTGTVANPQHRLRVHGAAPILLLHARHDPTTPYSWAQAVHKQIPGSVLLTSEGHDHVTNRGYDTCVGAATDTYLTTGELPAEGTSCPAVEPPAQRR